MANIERQIFHHGIDKVMNMKVRQSYSHAKNSKSYYRSGEVQQRVPCESARQLLDVVLRHDVSLAAATASWSGISDWTHPSAGLDLHPSKGAQ